jgi:hypothetical protein
MQELSRSTNWWGHKMAPRHASAKTLFMTPECGQTCSIKIKYKLFTAMLDLEVVLCSSDYKIIDMERF